MAYPLPEEKISVPRFEESSGFYTTPERSKMMSKIRATNTKPEIALRKVLWGFGLRYRIHVKGLPGKPDIVFARWKVVIFVDGDFWHGYDWARKKEKLSTNKDFWIPKIERNMQRDREVDAQLQNMGWQVLRIWENDLKKNFGGCALSALRFIQKHAGPDVGELL